MEQNELIQDEIQEGVDTLKAEYFLPLDLDNLEGIKFDKKAFQKGINDISEMCGKICALTNVGITAQDALSFMINERTIEHNLTNQKLINDNNVDIAKIQAVKIDSQTL